MSRTERQFIQPDNLAGGRTYSHGIRAGSLLFVGGQLPLDSAGNLVGAGDIYAQADQVFQNILAVLAAGGASVEDVVRLDGYYVRPDDRLAILEVRQKYFGAHKPCSVSVIVNRLADPDWLLEVQAIAVV